MNAISTRPWARTFRSASSGRASPASPPPASLAARGHKVILFDKNPWLGGKAAQLEQDGFRFDMGPTILTVPHVLERVFTEAGRNMADYLDLRRLDPQWRCFFEDGSVLDLEESVPAMAAKLATYAPGNEQGYKDFIAMSAKLHEVSEKFFFWKSVEGISDTLSMKGMNLDTLRDVLSLRMGTSVASQIRKRTPDARVSQMLDHFVQYVGSSPYAAPAVLCSIAHMQTDLGVWYPMGGTRAVPQALERLAGELGVDLRPSTGISRILSHEGRAAGVVTESGETVRLAAVVSNMDSVRTMNELVGGAPQAKFARRWKRDPACSGVVLYLGLDRAYDHLAHHDFVFSKDPPRSSTGSTTRASPRPTPPATSPQPPAPSPASPPRVARPSTSSSTPPTSAATTTGRRCSRPTARSSSTSSSAAPACPTSRTASSSNATSRRRTSTTATAS